MKKTAGFWKKKFNFFKKYAVLFYKTASGDSINCSYNKAVVAARITSHFMLY